MIIVPLLVLLQTERPQCEPEHKGTLLLHHINTERQLQKWFDPVAVKKASMLLGNIVWTWFLTHCTQSTIWAELDFGMRARFSIH